LGNSRRSHYRRGELAVGVHPMDFLDEEELKGGGHGHINKAEYRTISQTKEQRRKAQLRKDSESKKPQKPKTKTNVQRFSDIDFPSLGS